MIINLGMPKTGSTSLQYFFKCGGSYKASHDICGAVSCGDCIRNNVENKRTPFTDCGDYNAWTQMDMCQPPDHCYFPQIDALPALLQAYPNAIYLLPKRDTRDWIQSLKEWDNRGKFRPMDVRFKDCRFATRGPITSFEEFLQDHFSRVRSLCSKHGVTLVEFFLEQAGPLFHAFPDIKQTCWGNHNQN